MTEKELEDNIVRIEQAISTLAWWLVQAQSGLSQQDASGIDDILYGKNRQFVKMAKP